MAGTKVGLLSSTMIIRGTKSAKFTFSIMALTIDVFGSITLKDSSRLSHDILPMYEKISSIRIDFNNTCPTWGKYKETLIHAMKDCLMARAIEDVARELDNKAIFDLITVLWNVWNSRNNHIFHDEEEEAKVTWERAAFLSHDFRNFNLVEKPLLPRTTMEKVRRKPLQGVIKINFDATTLNKKKSYGLVERDFGGFVLGSFMGVLDKELQIDWRNCRH
ncbi:hypothetical protein CXB51_009517 [Gossypium anomalum]|uniref:RNase H type-1 domain-containing protein n=1 Tax=Gossypium anomalum TaxID=47600 RepID=A0A8J5YYR6_9ROSI|nr:hypothetical protein CXB51_009517 [Gossypium anomalum]